MSVNELLQVVALRIVSVYLARNGADNVAVLSDGHDTGEGTDLVCRIDGRSRTVKVKADPYCGIDPKRVADRAFVFYRRAGTDYALEAIADNATRQAGWAFDSGAEQVYYYFLGLGQTEAEVAALVGKPESVFLSELRVETDELHVIPMRELQAWFTDHCEQCTPRPVVLSDHSAWYRLVPRDVLQSAIPVKIVGPIFDSIAQE